MKSICDQSRWERVERRYQIRNRTWDESILFTQDDDFISAMWELLPLYVYLSRGEDGTFTLTTYDLDQQRLISVYLASNIEAIRHINFALANSQSM